MQDVAMQKAIIDLQVIQNRPRIRIARRGALEWPQPTRPFGPLLGFDEGTYPWRRKQSLPRVDSSSTQRNKRKAVKSLGRVWKVGSCLSMEGICSLIVAFVAFWFQSILGEWRCEGFGAKRGGGVTLLLPPPRLTPFSKIFGTNPQVSGFFLYCVKEHNTVQARRHCS